MPAKRPQLAQWTKTPIVNFGTHLPVLIKVLSLTNGPCLEMGMGFNSSIVMHWMCAGADRLLVSYEHDRQYMGWPFRAGKFAQGLHQVHLIQSYDEANIERQWDVAFLDHSPAERRIVDIRRLAKFAKYIVIHDSEGRNNRHFHYQEIYPLFKWQYNYDKFVPKTTVLSNLVDLSDFHV